MTFKPGDLVMVVKPGTCCGDISEIGLVHTVLEHNGLASKCRKCGAIADPSETTLLTVRGFAPSTSRLRLIPPLSDDAEITREMEAA